MLHFNTSVVDLANHRQKNTHKKTWIGSNHPVWPVTKAGSILQVIYISNKSNLPTCSLSFFPRCWLDGVILGWQKEALSSIFIACFKRCPLVDLKILLPEPTVIRPLNTDMIACTTIASLNVILLSENCSFLLLVLVNTNHPTIHFRVNAIIRVC